MITGGLEGVCVCLILKLARLCVYSILTSKLAQILDEGIVDMPPGE